MYGREKMVIQGRLLYVILMLSATVLGISGCAVPPNTQHRTGVVVSGQNTGDIENARFTLVDGSIGTLRNAGDDYILKFEKFSRVIQLGKAQSMQLEQTVRINDSVVLVINNVQKNGCIKTSLFAIRANEVQDWHVVSSNCKVVPRIEFNNAKIVLNYPSSQFIYQDGVGLKENSFAPPIIQQKIENRKLDKLNNSDKKLSTVKEIKVINSIKEKKLIKEIRDVRETQEINDFGSLVEVDKPIVIDLQKK